MKTKYIIAFIILGLAVTAFNGCSLLRKRVEKTEKVEYKFTTANKTKLSVDDANGEIKITKADDTQGMVIVEAIIRADVKQDEMDKPIENIKIKIDTAGSVIKIETEINRTGGLFKGHRRSGRVDYNIKVPSNISIAIDNVNGDITLVRIDSDINIETVNSTINLNRCAGNITIDGTNGGVYANFDSTKGINIEMVNGTVKLGGLKNISADVNANTINGRIKFNNLSFDNLQAEKKSLTGTLGGGRNSIKVSTVNGNITFDANQVSYKKHDDFNFKIDFDDDGDLDIYKRNNDDDDDKEDNNRHGNQIDTNAKSRNTDTNKIPQEIKKIDTVKKK